MRSWWLILLCACGDTTTFGGYCGNVGPGQCYDLDGFGRIDTAGYPGECAPGFPRCDGDTMMECSGAVYPVRDICDGLDNDCDGAIDENSSRVLARTLDDDDPCPGPYGVCSGAVAECLDGAWACELPSTYEEEETLCDGLDNDCDGLVDDALGFMEWCYPGDWADSTRPPCRPGFKECLGGVVECVGAITPLPDICDGIDNDCDGVIDNGPTSPEWDVFILVDNSGSMCGKIGRVTAGLRLFLESTNTPLVRFSLVDISIGYGPPWFGVVSPFSQGLQAAQGLVEYDCLGSGNEAALDAVWAACSNNLDPIREGANVAVLLFTDERPVSQVVPPYTLESALDVCAWIGAPIHVWGSAAALSSGSGGYLNSLASDPSEIDEQLRGIVSPECN